MWVWVCTKTQPSFPLSSVLPFSRLCLVTFTHVSQTAIFAGDRFRWIRRIQLNVLEGMSRGTTTWKLMGRKMDQSPGEGKREKSTRRNESDAGPYLQRKVPNFLPLQSLVLLKQDPLHYFYVDSNWNQNFVRSLLEAVSERISNSFFSRIVGSTFDFPFLSIV